MPTSERRDGKTPNGGIYSQAFYYDDDMKAVDKSEATRMTIIEYDKNDKPIYRTYGTLGKKKAD